MVKKRIVSSNFENDAEKRFLWSENFLRDEESLYTIVHKYCFLNQPTRQELLEDIGISKPNTLSLDLLRGLSFSKSQTGFNITGKLTKNSKSFRRFLYSKLLIDNIYERTFPAKINFRSTMIAENFRYCPQCLEQYSFHSIVFQCLGIRYCPYHNELLRSGCKSCGQKLSTKLNHTTFNHFFECSYCGSEMAKERQLLYPIALPGQLIQKLKICRRLIKKIYLDKLYYLYFPDSMMRLQTFHPGNVWDALFYSELSHNDNCEKVTSYEHVIGHEVKEPEYTFRLDSSELVRQILTIKVIDFSEELLFESVLRQFVHKMNQVAKQDLKNQRLINETISLFKKHFENHYTKTRVVFCRTILSQLKQNEKLEVPALSKLNVKLPVFTSISNTRKPLYEEIIQHTISYFAYLAGIFEEMLVLSQLLAEKSFWTREYCFNACCGSGIPQIVVSFPKNEILVNVFPSEIDVDYLKYKVKKSEETAERLANVRGKSGASRAGVL